MANLEAKINMYGTAPGSIVDGPGIRFGVFVQGCSHHCEGCHNQGSQAHGKGKDRTVAQIIEEFDSSKSCTGVTLSGGEPFEQAEAVAQLASALKNRGVNVWCYTGYLLEDLLAIANAQETPVSSPYCNKMNAEAVNKLLHNIDVLVDGEFKKDEKSYEALYRGSKNQRLIDMEKTLSTGSIVEWSKGFELPKRPES